MGNKGSIPDNYEIKKIPKKISDIKKTSKCNNMNLTNPIIYDDKYN